MSQVPTQTTTGNAMEGPQEMRPANFTSSNASPSPAPSRTNMLSTGGSIPVLSSGQPGGAQVLSQTEAVQEIRQMDATGTSLDRGSERSRSTGNSSRRGRKRKKTSDVYSYIKKGTAQDGTVVHKCEQCGSEFSLSSSTSTLRTHLQKHGLLLDLPTNQQRFKVDGSLALENKARTEQRQRNLEQAMARWIVSSQQPFSVVESDDFKNMFRILDSEVDVPSRHTMRNRVLAREDDYFLQMKYFLHLSKSKVALTADAWSSSIYKGYMSVTAHWVDNGWVMHSALLEFKRFLTPHTGEAAKVFLKEVIGEWNLNRRISSVTTDNAADMVKGIELLRKDLDKETPGMYASTSFHTRCVAHVINLAVKECMSDIHSKIDKVRKLLNAIRASIKRRDVFDSVKLEFNMDVGLPELDVETRWSSTFGMLKSAYKARRLLNAVIERVPELGDSTISNADWELTKKLCEFLEPPALATEQQSGSTYCTLSVTTRTYDRMVKICELKECQEDDDLKPLADKMKKKLEQYKDLIKSSTAQLASALDPRIRSYGAADGDLLRKNLPVIASTQDIPEVVCMTGNGGARNVFQQVLDDRSRDGEANDEVARFVRFTATSDHDADPFSWWKAHDKRFPALAKLARDLLPVQASSVASESTFSGAGTLIRDNRSSLGDDTIRANMRLRSWQRIIGSDLL